MKTGSRSLLLALVSRQLLLGLFLALIGRYTAEAASMRFCKAMCGETIAASCSGLRKGKLRRCRTRLLKECKHNRLDCAPPETTTTLAPATTTLPPVTTSTLGPATTLPPVTTSTLGPATTLSPVTTSTLGPTTTTTTIPACSLANGSLTTVLAATSGGVVAGNLIIDSGAVDSDGDPMVLTSVSFDPFISSQELAAVQSTAPTGDVIISIYTGGIQDLAHLVGTLDVNLTMGLYTYTNGAGALIGSNKSVEIDFFLNDADRDCSLLTGTLDIEVIIPA